MLLVSHKLLMSTLNNPALFLDRSIIHAPRFQFGLLDAGARLNCSIHNYTGNHATDIKWTRNSTTFNGSFERVGLHHEGQYMCEVFLSDIDLIMRSSVQFTVIGKLTSSTLVLGGESLCHSSYSHCSCTQYNDSTFTETDVHLKRKTELHCVF